MRRLEATELSSTVIDIMTFNAPNGVMVSPRSSKSSATGRARRPRKSRSTSSVAALGGPPARTPI
jgi:hypothetical protein